MPNRPNVHVYDAVAKEMQSTGHGNVTVEQCRQAFSRITAKVRAINGMLNQN